MSVQEAKAANNPLNEERSKARRVQWESLMALTRKLTIKSPLKNVKKEEKCR